LDLLTRLDQEGVRAAAHGDGLVHFDLFPHNVMLTHGRVYFVDWPHARRGNPLTDLVSVLCPIALAGRDPSPIAEAHPLAADVDSQSLDAIIAALAGFSVLGALLPARPEQQAIVDAKRELATAMLTWLARRRG